MVMSGFELVTSVNEGSCISSTTGAQRCHTIRERQGPISGVLAEIFKDLPHAEYVVSGDASVFTVLCEISYRSTFVILFISASEETLGVLMINMFRNLTPKTVWYDLYFHLIVFATNHEEEIPPGKYNQNCYPLYGYIYFQGGRGRVLIRWLP